jgi:invasion protein IalB
MQLKNKLLTLALLASISGVSVAQEAPESKQTSEKFGDWQVLCAEKAGAKECRMSQSFSNDKKQLVAAVNLIQNAGQKPILEMALPLMVDLTLPVRVSVEGKVQGNYPYKVCNGQACFVLTEATTALTDAFKKGNKADFIFKPVNSDKAVRIELSLKGFTAAHNAMNQR